MFLAAAAATLAAALAVRLAARALVDGDHRLRLDLLVPRGDGATGVAWFVHDEVAQVCWQSCVPRCTAHSRHGNAFLMQHVHASVLSTSDAEQHGTWYKNANIMRRNPCVAS